MVIHLVLVVATYIVNIKQAQGVVMRKKSTLLNTITRCFVYLMICEFIFGGVTGCSLLRKSKKNNESVCITDLDMSEQNFLNCESEKQSAVLSEYVTQISRSSKEKKKVSVGDTFLMSDKAKEIYANTER